MISNGPAAAANFAAAAGPYNFCAPHFFLNFAPNAANFCHYLPACRKFAREPCPLAFIMLRWKILCIDAPALRTYNFPVINFSPRHARCAAAFTEDNMKITFIILAALTALTMAGCAGGGEGALPPVDDELAGDTPSGEGTGDGSDGSDDPEELPDDDAELPVGPVLPDEPEQPEEQPQKPVQPEQPEQAYKKYVTLTADGVNIRKGAGTSYAVLGAGEEDTSYMYLGEVDGWYKVYYKNSTAYISKKYSAIMEMKASANEEVESVIYEGGKLLGTTYVYGATRYHDGKGNKLKGFTLSAFDCSSLMQYMFYMGADGHLLGVTTRTQVLQGKTVARSDLQRGDLMFFTNSSRYNKTGVERIGHVALYLGDNLILHTASDYAKIEHISSARWKYYIQAQRMI